MYDIAFHSFYDFWIIFSIMWYVLFFIFLLDFDAVMTACYFVFILLLCRLHVSRGKCEMLRWIKMFNSYVFVWKFWKLCLLSRWFTICT